MTIVESIALVALVRRSAAAIVSTGDLHAVAKLLGGVDQSSPDLAPGLLVVRPSVNRDAGCTRLEVIASAGGAPAFVVLTLVAGVVVADLAAELGPGRSVPGPYGPSWCWDVASEGRPVVMFAELEPDRTIGSLMIRRDGP